MMPNASAIRTAMGEPYRTLLGHFRHESGHYFWDVLVRDGGRLDSFRAIFGDEQQDYSAALQAHYANGPAPDWQQNYVSAYASAHPWEDFAETWAHYMHIVDTLETAQSFGVKVQARPGRRTELAAAIDFEPHARGEYRSTDRRVAAACVCGEQSQPQHGDRRSLSLRAFTRGDRQARLYPRIDAQQKPGLGDQVRERRGVPAVREHGGFQRVAIHTQLIAQETLEHLPHVESRREIAVLEQFRVRKRRPIADDAALFQCAAREDHGGSRAVIGAVRSVDAGGSPEFGDGDDDGVGPFGAQPFVQAGDDIVQILQMVCELAIGSTLIGVGVEAIERKNGDGRAAILRQEFRGRGREFFYGAGLEGLVAA